MALLRGKEAKFDWFQVTFDFIEVKKQSAYHYSFDLKHKLFRELLQILKRKENPEEFESRDKGDLNFPHGIRIDEFISLSWGANKLANEKYPMMLMISGQGCRTFEQMGGSWMELFTFFQKYGQDYLKYGRVDLAIDDYEGKEISIQQIYKLLRKGHYVTQFRKFKLEDGWTHNGETSGYTITCGSRGSNQLQIYDKKAERKQVEQYDYDVDIWNRYELRFADDKAKQVIDYYTASVIENEDYSIFMNYAVGLLKGALDLKKVNPNDTNKRRWETLPAWDRFCNSVKKKSLNIGSRIETTIEKKLVWVEQDLPTTILDVYIATGSDLQTFFNELLSIMAKAKYERKHIVRMNNFLRKFDSSEITTSDISKLQEEFRTIAPSISTIENILDSPEIKEGHCEYITFIQLHEDRIEIIDPWSGEVIKTFHDFSGDVEKRKNKKKSGDNQ